MTKKQALKKMIAAHDAYLKAADQFTETSGIYVFRETHLHIYDSGTRWPNLIKSMGIRGITIPEYGGKDGYVSHIYMINGMEFLWLSNREESDGT